MAMTKPRKRKALPPLTPLERAAIELERAWNREDSTDWLETWEHKVVKFRATAAREARRRERVK